MRIWWIGMHKCEIACCISSFEQQINEFEWRYYDAWAILTKMNASNVKLNEKNMKLAEKTCTVTRGGFGQIWNNFINFFIKNKGILGLMWGLASTNKEDIMPYRDFFSLFYFMLIFFGQSLSKVTPGSGWLWTTIETLLYTLLDRYLSKDKLPMGDFKLLKFFVFKF